MSGTRILVVDDHEIIRQWFRSILNTHPEMGTLPQGHYGEDAILKARSVKPDVIGFDITMSNLGGL